LTPAAPGRRAADGCAALTDRFRAFAVALPAQEITLLRFLFALALPALLLPVGPVAAQDAAAGEKLFSQCRACHQVGDKARNAVGPVLNGLFGRKAGTVEGYSYSPANKNSGLTWDEATFRDYIKDPKAKIPGTKMMYPGLKDDARIGDLVAYLKQFDAAGNRSAGTP
jgi:cytochrome c